MMTDTTKKLGTNFARSYGDPFGRLTRWVSSLQNRGQATNLAGDAKDAPNNDPAFDATRGHVPLRSRTTGGRLTRQSFALETETYPLGGLQLFIRMQRDAQIRACLSTKIACVLSESVQVHPATNRTATETARAARIAQDVEAQLHQIPGGTNGLVTGALDALAMGCSIGEMIWKEEGTLERVFFHDPRRFIFHGDRYGQLTRLEIPDAGLLLPVEQFLVYSYRARYGDPYGESDLIAAYEPWTRKQVKARMYLVALDRYGSPTPVAHVPPNWSQAEMDDLAARLAAVQNESGLVVPNDVTLSTPMDTRRMEPGSGFENALEYENREIAKAILGQELTTQGAGAGGAGSYALARVHQDVLTAHIHALRADLCTHLFAPLARAITTYQYGASAVHLAPTIAFPNLTLTEQSARLELVQGLLVGQIVAPNELWIREWLGIPKRMENEDS